MPDDAKQPDPLLAAAREAVAAWERWRTVLYNAGATRSELFDAGLARDAAMYCLRDAVAAAGEGT